MAANTNRSRGFTIIEVLVALAIIAVLAAVTIPALNGKLRDSRASAIAQTLNGLAAGSGEYRKALGRYPGQLTLLASNPVAGSSRDLCGTLLTASTTALWRGPYITREFSTAGMPMGDGRVMPGVRRSPTAVSSTGAIAYALIDIEDVELGVATKLDLEFDAAADATAGTIRYTSSTIAAQVSPANPTPAITSEPGTVTVTYAIPVNSTGC